MYVLERSLDIALNTAAVEPDRGETIVTPLSSTESLVAARGLATHISMLYDGVRKRADENTALLEVYNFIDDKVDGFRQRAYNLSGALTTELGQLTPQRALAAAAIVYFVYGQRAHKTGVWLKGKNLEEKLVGYYHNELALDDEAFDQDLKWASQRAVKNRIYWRKQLESVRQSPLIQRIRESIEQSDHKPIRV